MSCEAYEASNVLYCFCSSALTNSIKTYGFIKGPKRMWDAKPCRGFTKDYLIKNSFMLFAAGIVVVVNFLLNNILRMFAVFERHSSESTRTIRVAVRMFVAQFLNTAIIVMLVNASFGLGNVKVAKELLGGKYADFERGWYPTVGMGIATTMLLNAFLPQITLFMHMYVVSPIHRWYKRRSIRTQAKMDKLYAGPTFDISQRYPMVLNSVFVTMVFCGGSPILLFIATVASAGVYWFDKLSILYLYSVKTTYDEILGKVTIQVLPWTLAMHLGFSAWMYGNTDLLKGSVLNLPWLLRSVGLKAVLLDHPNATSDELYGILTDKLGKYDVLGKHGFLVKIVFSQVMLMTILCFAVTFGLLLYIIFGKLVFVVLRQMLVFLKHVVFIPVELFHALFSKDDEARAKEAERRQQKKKEKLPVVILPEFTEPFVMSVSRRYRPDDGLGFQRCRVDNTYELTCVWPKDIVHENGVARTAGDRKLSWETMQAPVTSYAIEANEKYRYPVKQILNAWKRVKEVRREHSPEPVHLEKVTPVIAKNESHVETAVAATEIVTIVAEGKNDGDTEDALTETRPEETADSIETDAAIEPVDEEPASDSTEANGNGEVSTDTPAIETTAASAEAAQEQLVDNK
ncbi:Transmembrane protein [Phytophthora palmivora]|uniref:Transmembrane protein n=1 Tax=Phytophthora palmivora TaxID=4796 RepID=A0A2P4XQH6_9STRA|nr:Transmembrane protein [Phytophthora palmivora]